MITTVTLPLPIDRLVDAINRGDTDAFLGLFTETGVVDDWGRRFEGLAAIRAWSDAEFIGAHGHMEVKNVSRVHDLVTLAADWRSDFYSGACRFLFALDGARVRAMTIPTR